nr:hypothetical protein [Halomonas sp.]
MATILDGLRRGAQRSQGYFDRQTNRRIASEAAAREQTEFDQGQRDQQLSDVFSRGRTEKFIMVDPDQGQIQLSDTFKDKLASGDLLAQNYAIELINAGGRGKVPEGFKIDRINQGTDANGNTVFFVGGTNSDGSKGVITTDGTSDDDSAAKAFTADELFNQTKMAFRSKDGVLYGQRIVDLNDYANSRDLIVGSTQEQIFEKLGSNPAAQRQASAVIANAATPEEEVEVTNQLAQSVGVPPAQVPPAPQPSAPAPKAEPEPTPTPAAKPAPKDNSARIAQLEDELATIENRKTGNRRANVRAAQKKRAEINRLKEEQEPEEQGFLSRILTTPVQEPGAAVLPTIVEERVAPVVENKTVAEIDEAIEKGEVPTDPETVAAAAQDLQEQGVETVQDIAKLDPRRQAFAYAMIVASTPNDGNRVAVRNQMINILETGVSDRGEEARKQSDVRRQWASLGQSIRKYEQGVNKDAATAANSLRTSLYDDNFDDDGNLTGSLAAVKRIANEKIPSIYAQAIAADTPESRELLIETANMSLGLVLQQMAEAGESGGALDSFVSLFRSDVSGTMSPDVSKIQIAGDTLYYREMDDQGDVARVGEGVKIDELRKVSPEIADLLKAIAEENAKARSTDG